MSKRSNSRLSYDSERKRAGGSQLESVGDYEIVGLLGAGGMGSVYKARHRRLNRFVALKVLAEKRSGDPRALSRFFREMQAIGKPSNLVLDRSGQVRVLDLGLALFDAHHEEQLHDLTRDGQVMDNGTPTEAINTVISDGTGGSSAVILDGFCCSGVHIGRWAATETSVRSTVRVVSTRS